MKRYRAKRYTTITSSENENVMKFYKNDVMRFNPDDFEEVEEDRKTQQLQIKNDKTGLWEDVISIDYKEHEAWTDTGCYRPALNVFRLVEIENNQEKVEEEKEIEPVVLPVLLTWDSSKFGMWALDTIALRN